MKYIFSCLIDADRTDARRFDESDKSELFPDHSSLFRNSYQQLIDHLISLQSNVDNENPINLLRSQMSEYCERIANNPSSIYRLSIPTGGGKTLASLRYALKHVLKYNKERIIYIVPLTTILEQNASEVRRIIGNSEMVLEHHAYVIDDLDNEDAYDYYENVAYKKVQLARNNWDHPIIFTTLVKFLDTFYAKGTSKSRRLHHLTNSVIIFDEVQSVPVKHIPLFNSAVNFLHHFGNSSIVLCTATQPSLEESSYPLLMPRENEMIPNLHNVVKAFKRVQIVSKVTPEGWSAEQISTFAISKQSISPSILIILNTKKAVLNVYQKLKERNIDHVYHLSTSMCPKHRVHILSEIKSKLKNRTERIICVSTQLIEAGVDVSFQCVIRSLTGLDAVAQAAGRCNRHGELKKGMVYIIRSQDEVLTKLPEIQLGQEVLQDDVLSREHLKSNLLSSEAIGTYFDYFLSKAERGLPMADPQLNVKLIELLGICPKYLANIKRENNTFMKTMFKTLERHFEVIESHTIGLIVPYKQRGKEIIALLNEETNDYKLHNQLVREAQLYSVNVYRHTLRKLVEEDLVFPLASGMYALQQSGYHSEYGLSLEGRGESFLPIY